MKKKLSFLLALVFVLTLAFGALPVAGASQLTTDETLIIRKVVEAPDPLNPNQKFVIKVTFTDDDNEGAPITEEDMPNMIYNGPGTLDQDGNSYKITLSQATGLVATISNLRQHISWTVEEQPLPTGWQTPTYIDEVNPGHDDKNDGRGQFIQSGRTDEVIITNKFVEPPHGSLEIKKIVDTVGAPVQDVEFPMTIKFSPYDNLDRLTATLNGSPTSVDSNPIDGEYKFALKANDIIIFDNIPTGVAYEVKETLTSYLEGMGWQTPTYKDEGWNGSGDTDHDGKGLIVNDGSEDTLEVHNTYVAPKTGTLTIKKEIDTAQSDPYPDDVFTIRVQFFGDYLDGIGDTDDRIDKKGTGIYDVSLKIGEDVSFTDIPVGTRYEVSETEFPSTAWSLLTIENDDWADPYYTIDDLKDEVEIDVVTVKNVYKKPVVSDSLIITKSTTGYQGSPVMFNIKVTFTPLENYDTMSIQSIDLNHFTNTADAVGADGVYMLQIAGGSSVTFSGIPDGVSYLVEEVSVPSNWTFMEASSTGLSGDINAENDTTPRAIVVNNYTQPFIPTDNIQYGTLTVDKTATSASTTAAIGTEPFSFTVTFTANPTNVLGITNSLGLTGNNGVYTFTLTADAPAVVFSNIPTGTQYTVTEAISDAQVAAGWSQGTVTGDTGSITAAGATAAFENVLAVVAGDSDNGSDNEGGSNDNEGQQVAGEVDTALPQTGGISFSTLFGIFGLALIAIGGTAFTVLRKRFLGKSK